MKINRPLLHHIALASPLIFAPIASADIDTLEAWGNAAGTTPAPGLAAGGGTYALTGGGADIWGASDQGVFAWDSTGAMTTTGDFTATVRHVSTDEQAPTWGRDTLSVRATQSAGAVAADDAHYFSMRRTDGGLTTGVRGAAAGNTGNTAIVGQSGGSSSYAYFAVSREGDTLRSGHARDLGGTGIAGRWVQNDTRSIAAFNGGNEVVVGLGHQSHPQSGGGGADGINTGTFDSLTYQGSYDASPFGAAADTAGGTTWAPEGSLSISPTGAVTGSAFVREAGVATGEANDWTITATSTATNFVPQFGTSNVRDTNAKNANDIIPSANFRLDSSSAAGSGLTADIYLAANGGNQTANRAIINGNAANGTAIIPNVDWNGGSDNDANYNGLTGPASFAAAVQGVDPADGTAGAFSGNQDSYGVHMTGQIFIPADADRVNNATHGGEWITFQDGVDDYTYLEIDGVPLLDDNNWTSADGSNNNGANVALMDVSDPKFDDGEWVDFEMIMWEGGGGDAGKLYWSALDTDGDMASAPTPGEFVPDSVLTISGTNQIGDETTDGSFGLDLPNGEWSVELVNANTGAAFVSGPQVVNVVPEPSSSLLLTLAALGLASRRRRS